MAIGRSLPGRRGQYRTDRLGVTGNRVAEGVSRVVGISPDDREDGVVGVDGFVAVAAVLEFRIEELRRAVVPLDEDGLRRQVREEPERPLERFGRPEVGHVQRLDLTVR